MHHSNGFIDRSIKSSVLQTNGRNRRIALSVEQTTIWRLSTCLMLRASLWRRKYIWPYHLTQIFMNGCSCWCICAFVYQRTARAWNYLDDEWWITADKACHVQMRPEVPELCYTIQTLLVTNHDAILINRWFMISQNNRENKHYGNLNDDPMTAYGRHHHQQSQHQKIFTQRI